MSFLQSARIVLKRLPSRDAERAPGDRERPERIVLDVLPGVTPSPKPPVRIFIGTELAQHRAERVLVWSIEKVRDPARVYEIHLMKELVGFERRKWLTGFTNYRYAIPELAGGAGRAIYNDVDQVYLRDPAELFDLDMGDHGYLAKSPIETSVMLIDCERMSGLWNLGTARSQGRKELLGRASDTPGLPGPMAPAWNAFDEAYVQGESKCLHYTTLHTQPWQPFPSRFVYQHIPAGDVWHELERSADEAGFQLFSRERPSSQGQARASRIAGETRPAAALAPEEAADLQEALAGAEPASVLQVELDGRPLENAEALVASGLERVVPIARTTLLADAPPPEQRYDAVTSVGGLESVPVEDAPWVVEALFARARRLVWVRLGEREHGQGWHTDLRYCEELFRSVGLRHPDVHWRIAAHERGRSGQVRRRVREGGCLLTEHPRVWLLKSDKGGDTSMSVGLAEALGVPYETKGVRFTRLVRPHKRKLGRLAASFGLRWIGLDVARSDELAPPWPDVVVATGWRPAAIARWIKTRSGGRTRVVVMGRKAGQIVDLFDVAVACEHFGLPRHPRRVETLLPLNPASPARLAEEGARWADLLDGMRHPRVVLLVGGTTERHRLDSQTAWRIGNDVNAFAAELGGSVTAVTSRRTGEKATAALEAGLGYAGRIHRYEPGKKENPYFGFLAQADALVVTGESESMLAEAAATGKPVYVYPLPERGSNVWTRLNDWMVYRAHFRPFKKGAEARRKRRHQQGLEYLLAKGLQKGVVRPRRDTERLNQAIVRRGIAHFFGEPLDTKPRLPLREAEQVAPRVRALLGLRLPGEAAIEVTPRPSTSREEGASASQTPAAPEVAAVRTSPPSG